MKMLALANQALRRMTLETAKSQNWSGWDNADLDTVAHIHIQDRSVIAALDAVNDALETLNARLVLLEEKL